MFQKIQEFKELCAETEGWNSSVNDKKLGIQVENKRSKNKLLMCRS